MPRFLGLEIQSDVRCASGARVAFFPATALVACTAVLSPTEPESLTATIQRTDARAAQAIVGRVARTCFSDTAYDREWDIVALADADTDDQLTLTCHPIGLRMARKLYEAADAATGAPVHDFTAVGISATDAVTDYVLPTLAAKGMSWVAAGTIDATNRFDLSGQWASILEIVRAIAEPGRADAEWQLRRNGDTDYKLDLLTQVGASAGTLRIRTGHNLLAHQRSRSALEAVTRVCTRGSDAATPRTMADHLWLVDSKGTDGIGNYIELSDILGGDDPIRYDDQGKDLYVGSFDTHNPTLQLVTATRTSTQRVYMSSTAQFTAGKWCRFFVGSTVNGARVTSLTHPTAVLAPSAGGLGDLAEFLDRPELRGDCNLVPNPWMRDWSNSSNPPDNWTESAGTPANRTRARETTLVREGSPYSFRLTTTGTTTLYIETPDIPVWATSGRRHIPALWFHVVDVPAATTSAIVFELRTAAGTRIAEIGRWVRGDAPVTDTWFRITGAPMDLSSVTSKVRIRAIVTNTSGGAAASGWDVVFAHAMLHEGEVPAEDIEYSGGTRLWQEANRRLAEASSAVRDQDIRLLDLEADDPDVFGSLLITPGQDCELTDAVLAEVTTQRVLELRPDYLRPLESTIRLGRPATTAVRSLAEGPIEPAEEEEERASLDVRATSNDDEYVITWSGGPTVELSTDGGNTWDPPPASPITVERQSATGYVQYYRFRARSEVVGDPPVEHTVVVERKLYVPAAEPAITGVVITAVSTPCDGGGGFDLDVLAANMPGTETYEGEVDVLENAGGTDTHEAFSGVTPGSLPETITVALCAGNSTRIRIRARDGGVVIASYEVTQEIA
jgi:hypothetical protein